MWKDDLKFSVGQTVKIVRENEVWNGSVARIDEITNDSRYPYLLHFISSPRPNTEGNKFEWNEDSLDPYDQRRVRQERQRDKLDRVIEDNFPRRVDVFYSMGSGGAVVMEPNGNLVRVLADGTIDR
jgi:hypothetical protein